MNQDIIVAIATSRLEAAISIVRLSGKDVIPFVQSFFSGNIVDLPTRSIAYGYMMDGDQRIDEVLVSVFRGRHTFTGEDSVEINCHGGVFITDQILRLCLKKGARLAERGEFTKRAFLNGRIDLSQAEAVSDLITAQNEEASRLALNGIRGQISNFIKDLKEDLIKIITQVEVNIDYPEYDDIEELTNDVVLPQAKVLREKMADIIKQSENVRLIKDGISTVIVGKPNVGKSSLLNALLEEDKAIVTDIAGTTRDIVEGRVRLGPLILNMIDTAGIHETDDQIETIGVEKSLSLIKKADLVLLVLDGSKPLDDEDHRLIEETRHTHCITIINKADLGTNIDIDGIVISAKNNDIKELTHYIENEFDLSLLNRQDMHVLTNQRQYNLLIQAASALDDAINAMEIGIPLDIAVDDLTTCWEYLKDILGEQAKEDLLDELFKRFCVGK